MYGQTEATARMSYLPWEMSFEKPDGIGIPIPGGRFFLRDESGNPVEEPDRDGELIYCGDNVCMGYAVSPDDLAGGDTNHGVLSTGDIARRDRDGCYRIVGRKSRFVKIFGNRISLDEADRLLAEAGFDAACTGSDLGLDVHVAQRKDPDAVGIFLAKRLKLHRTSVRVRVVDSLPRTSSGKIDYRALQQ